MISIMALRWVRTQSTLSHPIDRETPGLPRRDPTLVLVNAMPANRAYSDHPSSPSRSRLLGLALASLLAFVVPACGTNPASPGVQVDQANVDPLDSWETRVAEVIERVRGSVVTLEYTATEAPQGPRRVASGIVISDDGDVLSVRIDSPTPSGPQGRPSAILARDSRGKRFAASWVAADAETGLTLLKIEPGHARATVPSPREPKLGMPILLIGNPFGLGHSVSRGYVSGLNRRLVLGPRHLGGLIQVDAGFHPGDSGALLADLHGGWIGVVRSGLAPPDSSPEGRPRDGENDHDLGFVLPARDALWVADQLKAHGRVDRAYLGITMANSTEVDEATTDDQGARLDRVIADTPADLAGLRSGDRILAVNGIPIRSAAELTDQLDRTLARTSISVELVRGDDPGQTPETVAIVTADRPTFEATRLERPARNSPIVKASEKIEPAQPR